MPRLLIVDDHPLYRLALAQTMRELPMTEVIEAASLDEARTQLAQVRDIDLVLLDLHLPGSHGLMGLASLRGEHPDVAVVIISANDDPLVIRRALAFGATGFIPKRATPQELKSAIAAVLACEDFIPEALRDAVAQVPLSSIDGHLAARLACLSPQQFRVLSLVAEGRLNKQIADFLGIQERTVKAHMTAIFERLDVRNRTQAGVLLRSLELADPARAPLP
ncbi:response regulator transcription factor [Tahibacter amnicola]|uniref:Response regulator transcription factor n=1 Tax=Tahibacter amnicola TaxID=2976241 RepID=A0ABY6BML2_9GAMM|nr:response regulator transcription factor [Tahibacter amnicola]UXI69806.1 response regulator transcription factor [Tahibacter amnicola]